MSGKKAKKRKEQIVKYENKNMSQDQMIEIHAEAYYRALKRIEEEKAKKVEQNQERKKYKWYEKVLLLLNVCSCPWIINKRFSINNRIYDSIPVIFVSGVLRFVGVITWLIGWIGIAIVIYSVATRKSINVLIAVVAITLAFLGGTFILAAGEFEKETDSNKIYAYSASIIALVSCIVSIIALMWM